MTDNSEHAANLPSGEPLDAKLQREIDEALGRRSLEEFMDEAEAAKTDVGQAGPGGLRQGNVVAVHKGDIFVDLGGRSQGVITADQFPPEEVPDVGDTVEVLVDHYDESEGLLILTRKGAAQKVAWATLNQGDVVEARVTGMNKGGLECDLKGIRAFMPTSQVDTARIRDISTLVGQRLRCLVVELDRKDQNVVLSRRELQEREAAEAREKTLAEIAAGQVRPGTVKNIMPYGAFIDLGGVDGLLHVSDMSHSRVEDPNQVVQPGQQLQVKVLKVEQGGRRISLGLKQLEPDPWEGAAEKYAAGQTVKGRVTNLARFGAFVEVEPGIEALLPISEMSWKKRINHPSEILSKGAEVEASVLEVDPSRQRMSLSLKAFEPDPWEGAEARYPANTPVEGTVARVVDFGAFVEVEPGLDGLVHVSELSSKPVSRPSDMVKVGQKVQARVLSCSESDRRMSLSMKALEAEPPPSETDKSSASRKKKPRKGPLKGGLD